MVEPMDDDLDCVVSVVLEVVPTSVDPFWALKFVMIGIMQWCHAFLCFLPRLVEGRFEVFRMEHEECFVDVVSLVLRPNLDQYNVANSGAR